MAERTEIAGLASTVAAVRLAEQGPNELPADRPVPWWSQLGAQLFHFFAVLLWVAGALAIVAGMVELGIAIFLVVVVNGIFAFVQEHRSERAAGRLRELVPRRAVVRRDGAWLEVDARSIVSEDVVALAAGDRVPADVRVIEGPGLTVDNSLLTGESVPVGVAQGQQAFAGTFVVEGDAVAKVVTTGVKTRLAGIAELVRGRTRPRTPLARELDRLVRIVAIVAGGIGLLFFGVGTLVGLPVQQGLLFAIGIAVALVPEGLLPTVTLSLSIGASRMAGRGALVRRLEAVETLGSTTFICSDKTGTLTSNQMSVVEVWTPAGVARIQGRGYEPTAEIDAPDPVRESLKTLALVAARSSSGRAIRRADQWVARGDPMEAALHALAMRVGLDVEADEHVRPQVARFPFDPHRRRMSSVVGASVYVKGAPDSVLERCTGGGPLRETAAAMASRGLRVIAIATRECASGRVPSTSEEAEAGLVLIGLVGLEDPPRPEVRGAIDACHRAGLRVAMITGDHPATARAIARQVGLKADLVVTGQDLPQDDAMLGALLDRDGVVVCRVSPEQKLSIARALQARGHVVAMTGDGVNDGPALRQADVGIAMGHGGTDVAREAADLVLLDDRFETIVYAIEQGRSTFANIRRFLTYHLTDNVAEVAPFALWALSGGRFPLALSVLQILCLDLLTDQLPALALGAEPPSPRALAMPPPRGHLIDGRLLVRAFGVLGPTEAVAAMSVFVLTLNSLGWQLGAVPPEPGQLALASGAVFVAIVVGQTATAFACRSATEPVWRLRLRSNPHLLGALLASWVIVVLLLEVPLLARLVGHRAPTLDGMALAMLTFPLVLAADAAYKTLARRSGERGRTLP